MREKDLAYALDWMAIQELVAEYGQAIDSGKDTGDWRRWANVFTPELTADYSRFMGGEPLTITREMAAEYGRVAVGAFTRVQHSTANTVRIHFKSDTQAQVMAYAEVSHYFDLGGVQQEWTLVGRYTHDVEKTAEGWRIRKVLLDPVHYRGNPLGLEFVKGRRLS
ncbi:nuclear transport factor 2 family protein [Myxococcus sp. K15C18031901]|uniref:nuclear transport factor 2 family protein n=1 Tax=Myxococcus dinghuensis TaxID=2906761 RepID=UPI0020A7DE9C|nr:nuclear transport factor 2 family protein [Myxococcus dinghuensis]MCP3098796.1 nuclear transport factor 2 family protein [Myxococcus dinghuensis]